MPGPSTAGKNIMADAWAAAATHASLHTADPGDTGANQSTAGRQAVTWTAAANGDVSLATLPSFTGGEASGPVHSIGFWTAATGGTFVGSFPRTGGDATFNAAGEYNATDGDLTDV